MVTSVEAHATRAGLSMLELGGNAVDAAVAVGYALAVTHPSAGNLGGGGFLLVRFRGKPTVALDFREQAPRAVTQAQFEAMLERGAVGPSASAVPGSVAGLNHAHRRWGRLPLATVLRPALELARSGFTLAPAQARIIALAAPKLRLDPAARAIFLPNNHPPKAGTRFVQRDLAGTLERIATSGDAGFYAGPTALAIAALKERGNGLIDPSDLAAYRAVERAPLRAAYQGAALDVMPPPSAGGVAVVQMLAMLDALHAAKLPRGSADAMHLFAEVAKRAHAERRFHVADPTGQGAATERDQRARWTNADTWLGPFPIDPQHATPASKLHPHYAAARAELDHTTHFATADADGTVVTCTTTLSASFGARYVVPGTGVVMNNSLAAFSTVGDNRLAAGRRMTSSMSPTLLLDGDGVAAALGTPGGDTIPNTVVQVLMNLVSYHLPLDVAVDAPRIHHGFVPDALRYERRTPPPRAILEALKRRGHQLIHPSAVIGDANNLVVVGGEFLGYADPREGGLAAAPRFVPASGGP
jgi:gamma-glutamyltranspeptidase / glutathione hydrolase